MTREQFLEKKNEYNVPGYTDAELQEHIDKCKELFDLDDNFQFIHVCPVCKHNFCSAVGCEMCGYYSGMFNESDDPVEKEKWVKANYAKMIAANKDYIFGLKYKGN